MRGRGLDERSVEVHVHRPEQRVRHTHGQSAAITPRHLGDLPLVHYAGSTGYRLARYVEERPTRHRMYPFTESPDRPGRDAGLLIRLAYCRFLRRLTGLDLARRELPRQLAFRNAATHHQDSAGTDNDGRRNHRQLGGQ